MIRPCCLLAVLAVGGICILAPPNAASAQDSTGEPGLSLASKLGDVAPQKTRGWDDFNPCQGGSCQGGSCQSCLCQGGSCQSCLCQGGSCQSCLCQGGSCQSCLCQGSPCQSCPCQNGSCQNGLCESGEATWIDKYLAAVDDCGCNNTDWKCCTGPALCGYADYLNWAARRPGLDFAAVVPLPVPPAQAAAPVPLVTDTLDLGRDNGVRAGFAYRFAAGWDLALDYTYFFTGNQATVTQGAPGVWELLAPRSIFSTTPMQSVEADGNLRLNIVDLEANWRSCLRDTVGFRAFGGFRWAEIDQQFNNTYQRILGITPITGTIHLPSSMNGEGIRCGAELEWRAGCGVRIFGRGAQSVLLADFHMRHFESDSRSATPLLDVPVTATQVVPVLEAAVGVAWGCGPWEISGGYEMSNWFNMAEINRPADSLFIDGAFVRAAFSR